MPSSQPFDTPPASSNSNANTNTNPNNSYFTYPVKYAVASALRRLPSNFRTTSSRSNSTSRDSSRTRCIQPTNHDRTPHQEDRLSQTQTQRPQTPNLIDLQDDDDDDFGDYADGSQLNSVVLPPPPPPPPPFAASSRNNSYTPSLRATPPPFQPPPLTPLSLAGLPRPSDHQILSTLIAEEIRLLLPPRLQLVDTWRILFSLARHGASLKTLYEICEEGRGTRAGFVVVIRDSGGGIFGAYLSDPPYPSKGHYYGTGECFLWKSAVLSSAFNAPLPSLSSLPPPPSADTTHATRSTTLGSPKNSISNGSSLRPPDNNGGTGTSTPERIRFKAFPYSGMNDYMIFCETGFLSVGGGDGHYGLWLDSALERGISSPCPTFGNEALSDDGQKFDVLGCEIWHVG